MSKKRHFQSSENQFCTCSRENVIVNNGIASYLALQFRCLCREWSDTVDGWELVKKAFPIDARGQAPKVGSPSNFNSIYASFWPVERDAPSL